MRKWIIMVAFACCGIVNVRGQFSNYPYASDEEYSHEIPEGIDAALQERVGIIHSENNNWWKTYQYRSEYVFAGMTNQAGTNISGGATNVYTNSIAVYTFVAWTNTTYPFVWTSTLTGVECVTTNYWPLRRSAMRYRHIQQVALLDGVSIMPWNAGQYIAHWVGPTNNLGRYTNDPFFLSMRAIIDRYDAGYVLDPVTNEYGYLTNGTAYYSRVDDPDLLWTLCDVVVTQSLTGFALHSHGTLDRVYGDTAVFLVTNAPAIRWHEVTTNAFVGGNVYLAGLIVNTHTSTASYSQTYAVSSTSPVPTDAMWYSITNASCDFGYTNDWFNVAYTSPVLSYVPFTPSYFPMTTNINAIIRLCDAMVWTWAQDYRVLAPVWTGSSQYTNTLFQEREISMDTGLTNYVDALTAAETEWNSSAWSATTTAAYVYQVSSVAGLSDSNTITFACKRTRARPETCAKYTNISCTADYYLSWVVTNSCDVDGVLTNWEYLATGAENSNRTEILGSYYPTNDMFPARGTSGAHNYSAYTPIADAYRIILKWNGENGIIWKTPEAP